MSFKSSSIRPTSDKVREAIFNILPTPFPFKNVLDLFAGTGALGIEAISRGADSVIFVLGSKAYSTLPGEIVIAETGLINTNTKNITNK